MAMFDLDFAQPLDDNEDRHIKSIVEFAVTSTSPSAVRDAALSLDFLASSQLCPMPNGILYTVQDVFIFAGSIFPYHSRYQEALVQLLSALHDLPRRPNTRQPAWNTLISGDLPGMLHEAYEGGLGIGTGIREGDALAIKRWRNYNSFEARLLAKDICNCSLHGLWAFRMALEDPTYRWGPAELLLDVAIDWLEVTGDKLLTSNEQWDSFGRGSELWSGYHGFCAERWKLWARRLDEASGNMVLNAEVRERADRAARMIDAVYPR